MFKRILVISFIYVCTALGWFILAGATIVRTESQDVRLRQAVGQLWGTKQIQQAPSVCCKPSAVESIDKSHTIPLDSSDIKVDLKLEHRKKGLLWYSTYNVVFSGRYEIVNSSEKDRNITFDFKFPVQRAVYDDFRFLVGGREIQDVQISSGNITRDIRLSAGQSKIIEISYESQGMDEWSYDFGSDINPVKNFSLVLNTDFADIDFPPESISPTDKERTGNGWKLTWRYSNLLTGAKIGMITPRKLNPGPWVSRVTATAPVSLFLFFFLLFVFTTIRKLRIHPMNYFFIGAAFFSFHLLLAYLVDHISIHMAFWICSAVSIFLVVSYMRLVVGARFAFVEIALSQLVYLVFFSYTFFFKGYTGLSITILCISTLFIIMQVTGKVDWNKVFAKEDETAGRL